MYSEDLLDKQREELDAADATEKELWVSRRLSLTSLSTEPTCLTSMYLFHRNPNYSLKCVLIAFDIYL